jgi:hypothetical protein
VNHRHLLPDEIDQLLDDEVGFGAAPLKAHLNECAVCQAQMADAQAVWRALEEAPRLSPSHRFAEHVMQDVTVLVPWHVAARETALGLIPRSRAARVGAAMVALASAAVISVILVWLLTETDVLVFASTIVGSRLRTLIVNASGSLVVALFGHQALAVFLKSGILGLVIVLLGFLGATVGALASLRAIAIAAGRRRS